MSANDLAPQARVKNVDEGRLLGVFARLCGIHVQAEAVQTAFMQCTDANGSALVNATQVLRTLGVDTRPMQSSIAKLQVAAVPVLAQDIEGNLMIVASVGDGAYTAHKSAWEAPRHVDEFSLRGDWSGEWVEFIPGNHRASELAPARFGLSWFLQSLSRHKRILSEVLLASLFLQVFALVTPLIFQVVIDKVLTHRSMATLDVLVLALLGLGVFEIVLGAMRHYILSHTTLRVDAELGSRLFRHLLRLPLAYFEARKTGDTVARIRELDNARHFLTGTALTSWLDLLFALVFLAVMLNYSVALTAIVIAALPVIFGASLIITPLMRRKLEDKSALGAENQSFLAETVSTMETLKGQAVEHLWQQDWDRKQSRYVSAAFGSGHLGNATNQFVSLASKLLSVLLLYFGAKLVIEGDLTVGGLIAFNMLATRVNAPILKLASVWQEITQLKVSIKRLGDIMDAAPEPLFDATRTTPPTLVGQITFDQVSFRYAPTAPEVLSSVSVEVKAGEVIGLTGISGSGKTTFTRLIQRLYVPERGRILVDGVDIGLIDATWLRRQVGVVGQDTALFNRTVRENIALAQPDMDIETVMQSAQLAGAHEFILQLPRGYDTIVGERGSKLSGGQRARIAIARALSCNPRILVLDEATAALDYESERAIHDNMKRICAGRTVFIVAHRLSTLRLADRIIVLENGRLVESGSHRDLVRVNGRYASLFRAHQILEAA